MSQPKPTKRVKYTDEKKEFGACAEIFLQKAYKVLKGGAKPESKIQIITVMQAIKNLLSTLKIELDPSWEERAKGGTHSVEEFNAAAKQLWAAGQRLQSAMKGSWPVKDEMSSLLDEILAVQVHESESN